jgi:hypothetical protein
VGVIIRFYNSDAWLRDHSARSVYESVRLVRASKYALMSIARDTRRTPENAPQVPGRILTVPKAQAALSVLLRSSIMARPH